MNQKDKLQDPFASLPASILKRSATAEGGKTQQTRKDIPTDPFASIPKKTPPPDPFAALSNKPKSGTEAAISTNTVTTFGGEGGRGGQ